MLEKRDIAVAIAVGFIGCAAIELAANAFVRFATALLVVVQP